MFASCVSNDEDAGGCFVASGKTECSPVFGWRGPLWGYFTLNKLSQPLSISEVF